MIAQYQAALQGQALAILPCFMAAGDPRLQEVLSQEVEVTRQFWIYYSEDLRRLKRITLVAEHLHHCAELNRSWLMGDSGSMLFPPG
ncbi:hypothetical protein D3C76_1504300 [compost metagenome]